jgi:hypothetical protein
MELVEGNVTITLQAIGGCRPCDPNEYRRLPRLMHDLADQVYEILGA